MRRPILAGNWKMNKTVGEAVALVKTLAPAVADVENVDIVVGPTFTALAAVHDVIAGTNIGLAAQNMHWEESGAFTGEIAPSMLTDVGCDYVIVAHSERRQYFGETNATANKRLHAAHAHGLTPIYCVGETLAQREGGVTEEVIGVQVKEGLAGLSDDRLLHTIIAYEPVWAIGTGRTATPEQAQAVHAFIRRTIASLTSEETASRVRIQYGGSVKPENVESLLREPDIDGALVGGASLKADSFAQMASIVNAI